VLQGNCTAEDGYAAARISIAEMLLTGTTCFLESMVCISYIKHCKIITRYSLQTGMVLTVFAERSKRVEFADVLVRSSWISQPMPNTRHGLCILVSWKIARCPFLEH
jgi:cytosine/adenosine deaminase-related metal-dependent hydrolase